MSRVPARPLGRLRGRATAPLTAAALGLVGAAAPPPGPTSGKPLFQAATANLNPWTEAKVDTKNPDRGPLLVISGERDHTVPWAIANASYQQQGNQGVTEIVEVKGRGHALTIDSGWREVADTGRPDRAWARGGRTGAARGPRPLAHLAGPRGAVAIAVWVALAATLALAFSVPFRQPTAPGSEATLVGRRG